MKLQRLESTTPHPLPEATERRQPSDEAPVRPVGALEGVEGDRQRSLQQEIAEIEPQAVGDFAGRERVRQGARAVAAELEALGAAADALIKPESLRRVLPGVDDSA